MVLIDGKGESMWSTLVFLLSYVLEVLYNGDVKLLEDLEIGMKRFC